MSNSVPAFKQDLDTGPWYRQRWTWFLMLGPAVVVVAGFITLWLAVTRPDALVVDDYYKQGLAINQDLRRDRIAESLKMDADMRYDAKSGILSGSIRSLGRPYSGHLRISFMHSTLPSKDMRLQVQPDAQGRFSIALPLLDMARWQVQIEGERLDWRLDATWKWPEQKRITLTATR